MNPKELAAEEKQELEQAREEDTRAGRHFKPATDIHETADALIVTMEMPGVEKDGIGVRLEKNVLSVTGDVDLSKYSELKPLYAEYNVGHFTRSFTVSSDIDQEGITADMADGVLTIKLPKREELAARRIEVG